MNQIARNEILSKRDENAPLLVTKTIDKIMTDETEIKDLVQNSSQGLVQYRNLFSHVSAAWAVQNVLCLMVHLMIYCVGIIIGFLR